MSNRYLKLNVFKIDFDLPPSFLFFQFSLLIFHISSSVNFVVSASKIYSPSDPFHNLHCYQIGIDLPLIHLLDDCKILLHYFLKSHYSYQSDFLRLCHSSTQSPLGASNLICIKILNLYNDAQRMYLMVSSQSSFPTTFHGSLFRPLWSC